MKTILLLRHGKSDWNADFNRDHARPLNERGRHAAERMGRFLAGCGSPPDQIVTSTAVRAQTTTDFAVQAGGLEAPVATRDDLYLASPETLLSVIRATGDGADTALFVGHQPGWGTTVGRLIGEAAVRFPTAACARIDVDVARWSDVAFGRGELIWLVPPKALGD